MVRISDTKGRKDGAYTRLFGDERIGHLMSQVHAASIRAGTELQNILIGLISKQYLITLDEISSKVFNGKSKGIVTSPTMPKAGEAPAIVSDFAIFYYSKLEFLVIELKDGDTFDTQKSPATKENLQKIVEFIRNRTGYKGRFYVCSFNADSPQSIIDGFKKTFTLNQVMTGKELCKHLGVSYQEVLNQRKGDQEENRYYLKGQIAKVENDLTPEEYFNEKKRIQTEQMRLHWRQDPDD